MFVVTNALRLRFFKPTPVACECNDNSCEIPTVQHVTKPVITEITISGMMCQHCQNHVHEALSAVEGVTNVDVSLEKGLATVTGDVDSQLLVDAVTQCGYKVVQYEKR